MFSRHSSKTSLILSDLKQNVIKKPIVNYTKQGKIKVQNSPHRMTESFQNVCNKSNMISDYNSNSHKIIIKSETDISSPIIVHIDSV